MVSHARNNIQVGHATASDHQVVEMHSAGLVFFAMILDLVFGEVDIANLFGTTEHIRQELP